VPSQDLILVRLTPCAADETGMPRVCDDVLAAARRGDLTLPGVSMSPTRHQRRARPARAAEA
jgi:hypothetical protein